MKKILLLLLLLPMCGAHPKIIIGEIMKKLLSIMLLSILVGACSTSEQKSEQAQKKVAVQKMNVGKELPLVLKYDMRSQDTLTALYVVSGDEGWNAYNVTVRTADNIIIKIEKR
jgi:uncharacterized protein YcfL